MVCPLVCVFSHVRVTSCRLSCMLLGAVSLVSILSCSCSLPAQGKVVELVSAIFGIKHDYFGSVMSNLAKVMSLTGYSVVCLFTYR